VVLRSHPFLVPALWHIFLRFGQPPEIHFFILLFSIQMKLCESRVFLDPKIYFAIMVQNNWSFRPKIDIAAKRHKTHKKNILHIGISNSYGCQKKFELFTIPSYLKIDSCLSMPAPRNAGLSFLKEGYLNSYLKFIFFLYFSCKYEYRLQICKK